MAVAADAIPIRAAIEAEAVVAEAAAAASARARLW